MERSSSQPHSQSNNQLTFMLVLLLGAIAALTPFAIDMYLPAMPEIAKDLMTSSGAVQVTLTAYTGGFAIGQLFHGPLADSYGRRPILLIGIFLFTIGAVLSAVSLDINQLTFVRAFQGFAGAAAAVVIQALVRDMFEKEEFARTMSFVTLVMTLAPLVAPMFGGYLAIWFGWRSIFWVLSLISIIVIFAVFFRIPETLASEKKQPFHFRSILRNYVKLSTTPIVLGYVFCGAFSFAGMFAFLTAGSFVYIEIYHVSLQHVGYLFGLNVVCLIIFTTLNGRLVRRVGSHNMLRFGLTVQLIAGICLVIGQLLGWGLWSIVIPVMFFVGSISTIGSNAMGCLLSDYGHIAGTASSLSGTLRFGVGAVAGSIIAMFPSTTAWPMVIMMAVCSVLSFGSYWWLAHHDK
ncbi:Bcr/CflA family multidrug efflux MFS transporter [Vibrio sp. SS-MA-C1-2]|uniref:Bcr/CflA family multidrug efflux MFS transporter n=1 Tax=Vibrio sp. SS-MA-C1-2 TaxID=2908646 RepID=UPI001F20A37F|nr:Bcr/CflA family multidrug efflux MFS transporter [Vibrio sp. SS-MA-C1-2]UJF20059.1 Bcr/CflA family multidrug efflux MFS transporter [Vibrio sp. SS-MA-C1-2]